MEGRHISLTEKRQPYLKRQLLQYSQSTFYHFNIIGMINMYMKNAHRLFLTQTLPKAQRTRGLSSDYQSNFFRLYHKFLHIS